MADGLKDDLQKVDLGIVLGNLLNDQGICWVLCILGKILRQKQMEEDDGY
ncbi:hypothetical protein [Alkaliphilus crotonatoxidans]